MIRKATKTQMPEQLLHQVQKVQKTKQTRDRRFAWLVGAAVLAFTMLVSMIVESQLNLFSYTLRFALTFLSLAITIVCTRFLWQRGKRDNERLLSAAQDVDAAYPALKERTATLTSCEENRLSDRHAAHPAMLNRLSEETAQIHQKVESKPIVSHRLLKRPLICLATAGLVMLGMFAWDAPKTMVQLGRFWTPWANLSTTQITAVEADSVFARNEPIKLNASLSGRSVDEVEFLSRQIDTSELSSTRLWPSTKGEAVAKFRQAKADVSFDYLFRAGDGQTEWYRATVTDRPKIKDLTMRIVPPEYTGNPAKVYRKLPKKLKVVAGSRLEMAVKPKTDVRTARLVMGETNWLPMKPSSDGEYDCSFELRQPIKFEVQLTELHGLQNRRPPRCNLQVVADQAPKIRILKPTKTAVLLPDEAIDIHFKATDDHGIKEMALRVYIQRAGEETVTVHEVEIPLDPDQSNKKIKGIVSLDLEQFGLKDGDGLHYAVRASDNFRPLENEIQPFTIQPMAGVKMLQGDASDQVLPDNLASSTNETQSPSPATSSADSPTPPASPSDSDVAQSGQSGQSGQRAQSAQQANSGATSPAQNQNASNQNASNQSNGEAQSSSSMGEPNAQNANPQQAATQPANENEPANENADKTPEESVATTESSNGQADKGAAPETSDPGDGMAANQERGAAEDLAATGGMTATEDSAADADNQASNEIKIQAEREPDQNPAANPDASKMAQTNPPNENNATAPATPAANANSNASQASSDKKPQSSAGQSQQANSSSANQQNSSSSTLSQSQSQSPSQSQMAANEESKPTTLEPDSDQDSTPSESDPVQMAQRTLDVGNGQSSSSGLQQIKVDKYAGGFTSEHRYKLEIAIEPTLTLLKESLKKSGKNVRQVTSDSAQNSVTGAAAKQKLSGASDLLKAATDAVTTLNEKTKKTPYAFVGLRLESIRSADVTPALIDVNKAIDTSGEPRIKNANNAWTHINRALESLTMLEEKYEQVKSNLKRADDILKFKKMHRVFIENSLAMLNPSKPSLNRQNRKGAEFDLDEEYLKRLKEVLQMREDMMAELARILADDPQLLRRFMNSMNESNWSIRDQLSLIVNEQRALSQKVHQWADATKTPVAHSINHFDVTESHLSEIQALSNRVADLQDEFISWLPLEKDVEKGDVAETVSEFRAAGNALTQIVADVEEMLVTGSLRSNFDREINALLEKANDADKALRKVDQSLRRMNNNVAVPELVNNAARRLPTIQSIRRASQQWIGKLELLKDDLVHEFYSVDQENLREELLQYGVKIASLESQLIGAFRGTAGQLPNEVKDNTKELQTLLDVEIPADQLVAAQTLLDGDPQNIAKRQQTKIIAKFDRAETMFNAILQAVTDELDKLPVEDPIASLLRDPTLDEILAELENERDALEELGISRRPTNLQTMGDWKGKSSVNAFRQMMMARQQRMRNLSNLAYRKAMERARARDKTKKKRKLAKDNERWNILATELGEDMMQGSNKIPPERYRSAINQYFEQISKLKNGEETE